MVVVDFSGNFLSAENCKAGDIGFFIDEGKLIPKTSKGRTWNQLTVTVDINQKQYSHSFRSAEGKKFQTLYGNDTKTWIGKQFKVTFVPYIDESTGTKVIKNGIEIVPVEEKS